MDVTDGRKVGADLKEALDGLSNARNIDPFYRIWSTTSWCFHIGIYLQGLFFFSLIFELILFHSIENTFILSLLSILE